MLYPADLCPYLISRSNLGQILQLIGDENVTHMRMQVSTGWRFMAIQMAANACQYMMKLTGI